MREEIHLVGVGEAELYVEDVGPKDAPVLVTVHGGPGGSSHAFRAFLGEELGDYRTIYFDQRGSGRSPRLPEDPRLFTIDALVDDMEHLRQALCIERWTPIAQGFGALLALEYARRFPAFTAGLVLIGPWVHFPWLVTRLWRAAMPGDPPEDPAEAARSLFETVPSKQVFDRLMFPTSHGRMEHEWVQDGAMLIADETMMRMLSVNGLWAFDYSPYLLEHPVRPWVIVGREDGTSYPEQAEVVADLTGGELVVVEGAGHHPWVDRGEVFVKRLYEALDEIYAFLGEAD